MEGEILTSNYKSIRALPQNKLDKNGLIIAT